MADNTETTGVIRTLLAHVKQGMTDKILYPVFGAILAVWSTVIAITTSPAPATAEAMQRSAYDFSFQAIEGGDLPLSEFKGKAVLVVNTASLCGFTPQYEGLQTLWTDFKDQGLVVIGVPSNDFGGQEPGSADEIKTFCEGTYSIDFPLTQKVVVKGSDAHPFYQWARTVLGEENAPRWNFHKYLIDSSGDLVASFPSTTRPSDNALRTSIKAALPKS